MAFTLYILQNAKGKLYIGQTNNLRDRLMRHDQDRSMYTKGKGPWELVYKEEYPSRSEAVNRERQLKKWRRELLERLIG